MFTFIISLIIVIFISLCFFKGKFWEHRYLVLAVSAGVALVATLVLNFITRNDLPTKAEVIWVRPLYTFYLNDSLLKDSTKTPLLMDYDYYNDYKASEFVKNKKIKQDSLTVLFYVDNNKLKIGTFDKPKSQDCYYFDDVYIVPTTNDTLAYITKSKLIYNVQSNWITGFSLPRISTQIVLHIPPSEYARIPDSLIRKPNF